MTYYNQYEQMEFGTFRHQGNMMDVLWERSALKHVAQARTPTLLMHGENNLRGWGQTYQPDPTLLYVRGFNPATQRYIYEVNQRFGSTKPSQTTVRQPVTVTALMRFDFGPARERTLLTQQLDRGRRLAGQKASESMLNAMYGAGGVTINPMAMILRQTDSLHLTSAQGDSLATMNRAYLIKLNRLWAPVIKELAGLSDTYSHDEAYALYKKTREASVDVLIGVAPRVKAVLNKEQQRKLPALVAAHLDPWYLNSIRSATAGGTGGGPFMFMGGGPGGAGRTRHRPAHRHARLQRGGLAARRDRLLARLRPRRGRAPRARPHGAGRERPIARGARPSAPRF